MDTVLGLSVTPTNVQTVLVEGRSGDGATLGHDAFDASGGGPVTRASDQVAEAVLSIANADGHRLHAIGVTWSDDADLEASLLLDSLTELGLANVVAVQSPRAAEALARSIGRMCGYQRTAVCVLEPDTVIVSSVDTYDGSGETSVNHDIDSDEQLVAYLRSVFDWEIRRPEGLFMVGSAGGLGPLAARLQGELGLPVFDPPEAELALAHGAALASASDPAEYALEHRRRWPALPLTMLVGGAVALVVSLSLVVGAHLVPQRDTAVTPVGSQQQEAQVKPPAAKRPSAPKSVPAPAPQAPPPEAPPAPEPIEQLPPAPEAPPPPEFEPAPVIEAVEQPVYQPPPVIEQAPAPVIAPAVPQVPEKPRLRDRIMDKIPGLNRFGN